MRFHSKLRILASYDALPIEDSLIEDSLSKIHSIVMMNQNSTFRFLKDTLVRDEITISQCFFNLNF